MRLRNLALVAPIALCFTSVNAGDQPISNDEGPFVSGVFSRPGGVPLQITPAAVDESKSPLLLDEEGNSNSVIVLLDCADSMALEVLLGDKIYPKKNMTQPTGTIRLMRKYNPVRDDHAIFPETMLSTMTAQGYTENSGSDWLGYVYPNSTGKVPVIY